MGRTYKDLNKSRSKQGLVELIKPKFKGHHQPKKNDNTSVLETDEEEEY